MENINKEDIHIISGNSNWSTKAVDKLLHNQIYSSKKDWQQFLRLFFISLGVSFTVAGIVFFFAYNWNDLHKFVKIGLIAGLILALTLFVVFVKNLGDTVKNSILTGTSILVGVLFAVFGQIYQTGANAYDFFLGWTMAIMLWVVVANFSVLWLLFLILINTTYFFYIKQVVGDLSPVTYFIFPIILNAAFLIVSNYANYRITEFKTAIWLTRIIALVLVMLITIGFVVGVFSKNMISFGYLILITLGLYALGYKQSMQTKNTFYIALIFFSILIMLLSIIIKGIDANFFDAIGVFLMISLLTVIGVTAIIKYLIHLQNKWKNV